jgi:hypothetical protein
MAATLSYELKSCMSILCKDARWNVLTVLILHANIRNRCYVSMPTIAEMATNGNLTKATRAKKWLEDHSAFTLVPYNKRVEEEQALPKRQHVYQLTGELTACADASCECHKVLKSAQSYLHYAKIEQPKSEIQTIQNFNQSEILPVENFNLAKILPIEIINGLNGSITNTSIKEKDSAPVGAGVALQKRKRKADPLFDAVRQHIFGIDDPNAEGGRIGKISNWLAGKYEGKSGQKVGKIGRPAEPKHVEAFAKYCKARGITPPRDFVKFVETWREWATSQRSRPSIATIPEDAVPIDHGVNAFVRTPRKQEAEDGAA